MIEDLMKLEQLLQIIKEYNNTFYFRKLIKGEHDRAKKLKKFVKALDQTEDYTLLPSEEYQLAKLLISLQDDIQLITQFKQLFHHSALFFKTFSQLELAELINEDNFSIIHTFDCHKASILNELCCDLKDKLNHKLIHIVLLVVDKSYLKEDFLACTTLLSTQMLQQEEVLLLLEKSVLLFLNIVKALTSSNQLNIPNLKLIAQYEHNIINVSQLLPTLIQANVEINSELLKSICESNKVHDVGTICIFIAAWDPSALNTACVKSLLQHTYLTSLWGIRDALKLLKKNQILNAHSLKAIVDSEEKHYVLASALATLDKRNLLNNTQFKRLIAPSLDIFAFSKYITCLDSINLLNNETLALTIPKKISSYLSDMLVIFPKTITLDAQILTQLALLEFGQLATINDIIKTLDEKKLITNTNFEKLLKLPTHYLVKLVHLISNLDSQNLLNNDNLDTLFIVLGNKLPKPQQERFTIQAQCTIDFLITQFQSIDANLNLYVKQDLEAPENKLKGGQAQIFQARESLDDGETHYFIKSFYKTEEQVDKAATRETKYARFLGRDSHFFQNNNQWLVVSKWQTGQALHDIPTDELLTIPVKMRIKSLCYLLHELSQLHKHFRIHGDIKTQNCVLDKASYQLKLIDFGSTRKVKPKNYTIAWTPTYLDKKTHCWDPTSRLSFCDDMYSLSFVTASLFPELYEVTFTKYDSQITLKQTEATLPITLKAIYYLVTSMQSNEKNARCTSQIAITYCQYLFTHFDTLDADKLASILEKTLSKKECSFDEVLMTQGFY